MRVQEVQVPNLQLQIHHELNGALPLRPKALQPVNDADSSETKIERYTFRDTQIYRASVTHVLSARVRTVSSSERCMAKTGVMYCMLNVHLKGYRSNVLSADSKHTSS